MSGQPSSKSCFEIVYISHVAINNNTSKPPAPPAATSSKAAKHMCMQDRRGRHRTNSRSPPSARTRAREATIQSTGHDIYMYNTTSTRQRLRACPLRFASGVLIRAHSATTKHIAPPVRTGGSGTSVGECQSKVAAGSLVLPTQVCTPTARTCRDTTQHHKRTSWVLGQSTKHNV